MMQLVQFYAEVTTLKIGAGAEDHHPKILRSINLIQPSGQLTNSVY